MKNWFISLFIPISSVAFGQSVENTPSKLGKAIDLMDNGNPDEAILLLEEAKKEDPKNYIYEYEKGYAYYIKQDYSAALKTYKKTVKYSNATDQCYQMLGNLYDITGDPAKALKAYDQGLKKFPNSGRLFVEKGNVFWGQEKYNEALLYYEEGIKAQPMYPSNYYRAALIFLNSSDPVWGMIYGEIFRNLEKDSKRTNEMSKLLFDTYKRNIKFNGDTVSVSFSRNNVINVSDSKDLKNLKLPFGAGSYEPTLLLSIVDEKEIDLNSLNRIRTNFLVNFYSKDFNRNFPVELFIYQKELMDAGHFEAYNYWLLMKGDQDNFSKWQSKNKDKWEKFLVWLQENKLFLDDNNKFYRSKID